MPYRADVVVINVFVVHNKLFYSKPWESGVLESAFHSVLQGFSANLEELTAELVPRGSLSARWIDVLIVTTIVILP